MGRMIVENHHAVPVLYPRLDLVKELLEVLGLGALASNEFHCVEVCRDATDDCN